MKIIFPCISALLLTLNCYSYEPQGKLIASIEDRSHGDQIRYYRDGNTIILTLMEQNQETELNRVEIHITASELSVTGSSKESFPIIKNTTEASQDAYKWCFESHDRRGFGPYRYNFMSTRAGEALTFMVAPGLITATLCSVLPALPVIAGGLLLPVDLTINGLHYFDADNVAKRKMDKLMTGESTKINHRAFKKLLNKVTKL